MDIVLYLPPPLTLTKSLGIWPSVVAVISGIHAPLTAGHTQALEYYREKQVTYGILWEEAKDGRFATYRLAQEMPDSATYSGDWRRSARGEMELVGVWSSPDTRGDGGELVSVGGPPSTAPVPVAG